jgi:peptidoglycan/xylan/chitin deacetylase (PgdA/CDA1 family)
LKTPTLDELDDFTLERYAELIQYLKGIYKIVPFNNVPQENIPYLILRHDVDWSLPSALKVAQVERDLGITSTYFILFSKSLYDVLENRNAAIVKQISKLGHEIGLHYCPQCYRSYSRNMDKTLEREIKLLERISGREVRSIARHGPWVRDPFAKTKKYVNANNPLMRGDLYVHDSCRAWSSLEDLFKLLNSPPKQVQLLTHPENWQDDKIDRKTLAGRLIKFAQEDPLILQEEILKKFWFEDPVVLEYDRAIRNKSFKQYSNIAHELNSRPKNSITKNLQKHTSLIRWQLVNTRFGWQCNQMISRIQRAITIN